MFTASMMVTNTAGKKDAVLTMGCVALTVILLKVLMNGLVFTVGGVTVTCGLIDGALVGAILTPTLGAYVARRYTESKFAVDSNNNGKIDPEERAKET